MKRRDMDDVVMSDGPKLLSVSRAAKRSKRKYPGFYWASRGVDASGRPLLYRDWTSGKKYRRYRQANMISLSRNKNHPRVVALGPSGTHFLGCLDAKKNIWKG